MGVAGGWHKRILRNVCKPNNWCTFFFLISFPLDRNCYYSWFNKIVCVCVCIWLLLCIIVSFLADRSKNCKILGFNLWIFMRMNLGISNYWVDVYSISSKLSLMSLKSNTLVKVGGKRGDWVWRGSFQYYSSVSITYAQSLQKNPIYLLCIVFPLTFRICVDLKSF